MGVQMTESRGMDAEDVPLILFPTLTLPGWVTWKRFLDAIGDSRPVLTFQLFANLWAYRGFDVPSGYCFSWETLAVERALREARMRGPLDLVGHSAGGALALDFALGGGGRVRSLTLIEPATPWVLRSAGAFDRFEGFLRERIRACSSEMTEDEYAAFLQDTLNTPGYDPRRSSHWPLLWAYRQNVRFRPYLYAHPDSLTRVRDAEFPVLLISGASSDEFHRAIVEILQSNFPSCRAIELPGGHAPHYWDGMPAFLDELERFHSEVGP
jgi:pimeloyl-ACP methyl ester carboxylesterase